MNYVKQSFWRNLSVMAKGILAHVNISYDGSKGAIRIDILPTEPEHILDQESRGKNIQGSEAKGLPQKEGTESELETDNASENEREKGVTEDNSDNEK